MADFDLDLTDNLDAKIELDDNTDNFQVEFGEVYYMAEKDFNKLNNRPLYNGQTMTGDTNIPLVPTKVSDLENDSDYQTGSEVESAISEAVAGKQDILTAGDNITIEDNVISATDTTYSAGNGLNLSNENAFSIDTTVVATQQNLATEVSNRENADINLQGQIDAISASSDVVDIVGTYADLQAYDTQHLKDNDIIKVLQDETQNNATTYYRWSTHTQTFTLIGQEGPYYTKASADAQFVPQTRTVNNKALSSNITLTASDVSAVATGDIVQVTGSNTAKVMSQKATTDALGLKLNISDYVVDAALANSTNPVQNKVLYGLFSSMPSDFFTGPVTVNGNGRDITLNGTMNAKLSDVKMYGDTFQQTYSGKNLFNVNGDFDYGSTNHKTTSNGDGTLTSTAVFSVSRSSGQRIEGLVANTTYTLTATIDSYTGTGKPNAGIIQVLNSSGSLSAIKTINFAVASGIPNTISETFTTPADVSAIWVSFNGNTTSGSGVAGSATFSGIQLEAGSSPTSYEPYVGGTASPNPDYPQNIDVVTGEQTVSVHGKNLCDGINQDYWLTSNAANAGVTAGNSGLIIQIQKNTSYTISTTASQARYRIALSDQTYQGSNFSTYDGVVKDGTSQSITINSTTHPYLIVNATDLTKIQVEKGSATAYEPYQGNNYTVDLGSIELCKIGNYQDYIYKSGGDWYVHKEIGKYTFTGSESFTKSGYSTTAAWAMWWVTTSLGIDVSIDNGYCEFGTVRYLNAMNTALNGIVFNNTTGSTFVKLQKAMITNWDESATDSDKIGYAKNMITGKSFYYVLATPTDTKITNADLISDLNALWNALSYDGQTNFAITASGLSGILDVTAYKKTLAGLIGAINRS